MSSVPPEAIAGLLGIVERFLGVIEHAIDREAEIRLAEVGKLESADYVTLDSTRQASAVDAMRIAAAAATESGKLFTAAAQAHSERVCARIAAEREERQEREARDARRSAEREAFRRSGGGRYQ